MEAIHRARLRELAEFLKKKEFNGIQRFDFTLFAHEIKECDNHICGTSACAVGFLPLVFPTRFKYLPGEERDVLFDGEPVYWAGPSVKKFLGITDQEFNCLFVPQEFVEPGDLFYFGGVMLENKATPEEVAFNIEVFLTWKGSKAEKKHLYNMYSWTCFGHKLKALWDYLTF